MPSASTTPDERPVDVGIVGLGWWGRTLVTEIGKSDDLRVVGAVARSSETAAWARENGLDVHADMSSLAESSLIDAIIVATPNTLHAPLAMTAAAAGKHVFCEKPLALTRAEAVAIAEACRAARVVLGVGHEIRFEPSVEAISVLARSGRLGQLVQFDGILSHDFFATLASDHWRISDFDAPAGPLTATGIHMVDLAVALLGRPTSVSAHLHRTQPTGTLSVLASFACGGRALIGASAVTPFHMRFAVYGTLGWAEAVSSPSPSGSGNAWSITTSLRNEGRTTSDFPNELGIRRNLEAFAAAVRGRAPYPISSDEMVDTIALLEAIVRSANRGGEQEAVESADRD